MTDEPLAILGPGGAYREGIMPDGSMQRYESEAATDAREDRRDDAGKELRGRSFRAPYDAAIRANVRLARTVVQLRRQIMELEMKLRVKGESVDDSNGNTAAAETGTGAERS